MKTDSTETLDLAGADSSLSLCAVYEVSVQYLETRERVFSVEAESHEDAKDIAAELMANQYAEAPCVAWSVVPYKSRRMDDEKCSSPNVAGQKSLAGTAEPKTR